MMESLEIMSAWYGATLWNNVHCWFVKKSNSHLTLTLFNRMVCHRIAVMYSQRDQRHGRSFQATGPALPVDQPRDVSKRCQRDRLESQSNCEMAA